MSMIVTVIEAVLLLTAGMTAVATRPTGPAKINKLIQVSLYAVVQDSSHLYRDIFDGLALLLDGYFHFAVPVLC